jgi:diguanylate cyclase (GGDEF)-like protein
MSSAPPRALGGDAAPHGASFALLERLRTPLWVFDIDAARVRWANAGALGIWEAESLGALSARDMRADMSPAVSHRLRQYQADFERNPGISFTEMWTLYPGGKPKPLRVVFSGFELEGGRMGMLCEGLVDHGAHPENLRSAEALLHTSVMITMYALDGRPLYRNPAARATAESVAATLEGHFTDAAGYARLRGQLDAFGEGRIVGRVRTTAGPRWHEITARRSHDAVTGDVAWLVSEVDVNELKNAEDRESYLANHDLLTGLPNRNFVSRGFRERVAELARAEESAALIFIDLDHFKNLNDSLGHAAGDELLVEVARRLRDMLPPGDLLARLGGDEFLVLAQSAEPREHVAVLAERILDVIAHAVRVGDSQVRVTTTLGVCFLPEDGADLDTLMRHADLAMYKAKSEGRNRVGYFTEALNVAVQARLTLENELRVALERNELVVYYQPRLDVATNAVAGAEALVRWQHPTRGLLLPGEFIAVAEDSGLIAPLGAWVLEAVAEASVAFRTRGVPVVLSVNLSPRQLADAGFIDVVRALVARTGCDPRRIELEITESTLLGRGEETEQVLEALCAMGFRISIDDFGTGYSNLAYLQRYPIHGLKIDRSFLHALDRTTPIAELILAMCKMLGVDTVAEGVETQAQLEWLRLHGCREYQGFLVSPAVPLQEFERSFVPRAASRPSFAVAGNGLPPAER